MSWDKSVILLSRRYSRVSTCKFFISGDTCLNLLLLRSYVSFFVRDHIPRGKSASLLFLRDMCFISCKFFISSETCLSLLLLSCNTAKLVRDHISWGKSSRRLSSSLMAIRFVNVFIAGDNLFNFLPVRSSLSTNKGSVLVGNPERVSNSEISFCTGLDLLFPIFLSVPAHTRGGDLLIFPFRVQSESL